MPLLLRSLAQQWRRGALAVLLLAATSLAWGQSDPPTRIAYVSALEGMARVAGASQSDPWEAATLNWPVTTGTQLQLDPGTRVELDGGWIVLRLQGPAELDTRLLDDRATQMALLDGSASLRVHELAPGERVEIDTPQLALVATEPGEYRIDVDAPAGTTRVTVHAGAATAYGDPGQPLALASGSELVFSGRDLGLLSSRPAATRDALDQWADLRDAQRERSVSARYLSRDMPGYQQLDAHGSWADDPAWGTVWFPNITVAGWAPYRQGRWIWVEPWGWTWVDDAPWGFAPFHYGRWTLIGPRWAWVPGPLQPRPAYAPALVQFFASGSGWSISIGNSPLGAAWFPLAPGEAWRPHYHASPVYLDRFNDWRHWRIPARPRTEGHLFQHRPGAISVAGVEAFDRRPHGSTPRTRFRDGRVLPADWLSGSRVGAPPERARPSRERPASRTPAPRRDEWAPGPYAPSRSLPSERPTPDRARPERPATSPMRPRPETTPENRRRRDHERPLRSDPPRSVPQTRPYVESGPRAPRADRQDERMERDRVRRPRESPEAAPRPWQPRAESGTWVRDPAGQPARAHEQAGVQAPRRHAAPATERAQASRVGRDRTWAGADAARAPRRDRGHGRLHRDASSP